MWTLLNPGVELQEISVLAAFEMIQPDNTLLAGAHRIAVRLNPGRTVDIVELTETEHAAVHVDTTRPINLTGR